MRVDGDTRGPILLRACGRGGLGYVTAESLGVMSDYLVYADTAPEDGYVNELLLDFKTRGGVVFVRTRDGAHYAKFEFTAIASEDQRVRIAGFGAQAGDANRTATPHQMRTRFRGGR